MDFLKTLGIGSSIPGCSSGRIWLSRKKRKKIPAYSPVDGEIFATVSKATTKDYDKIVKTAQNAFNEWQTTPAPARGEIIRQIGLQLRDFKQPLGKLISYETGKPLQEGLGEVQELIDICDFCVGQSRMLYGMTTVSERPNHRLFEQYHPLGPIAIITAFNFPMAVWGWNAMVAAVCGNVCIWKPSSKAVVSAVALQMVISRVLGKNHLPEGLFSLVIGNGNSLGETITNDHRIPLVSFTGSIPAGRHVSEKVAARLGRTILELGGNNAVILTEHADLKLALPAIVFGAIGTSGQRCTTTRRLIIHESIYQEVKKKLIGAYKSLKTGDPLIEKNHMGPLIDKGAVKDFQKAVRLIKKQGGSILTGGNCLPKGKKFPSGCYVEPTLAEVRNHMDIVQEETFAPILYLMKYNGGIHEAITINNDVAMGLSSSVFSTHHGQIETFLSAVGSDCGIANVNIGTSGAEIGGAFGGEKDTGGGRESGSDAWKNYMRRQTVTVNYGTDLPLAQGIQFDL